MIRSRLLSLGRLSEEEDTFGIFLTCVGNDPTAPCPPRQTCYGCDSAIATPRNSAARQSSTEFGSIDDFPGPRVTRMNGISDPSGSNEVQQRRLRQLNVSRATVREQLPTTAAGTWVVPDGLSVK